MTMFTRLVAAFVSTAAIIAASGTATAAPITWAAPVAITTADAALTMGSGVAGAEAWGGGNTTVTLASGEQIYFQNGTTNGSNSFASTSGAYGTTTGNTAGYNGTSNGAFNTVLGDFEYDGAQALTLQNLVVGTQYIVQLFAVDQRYCCGGNSQYYSDASGNLSLGSQFDAGNYVLGTFIADTTTETIIAYNTYGSLGGSGGIETNLNAVVLYTPEPASIAIFTTMLGGIAAARRRRGASRR